MHWKELNNMLALLRLFFKLCLFRQAPQDIPRSNALLSVIIALYAVIAFAVLAPHDDLLKGALEVVVEISVTAGFVWGILATANKPERYNQVLCALLGADALISSFTLPAIAASATGQLDASIVSVLLTLMIWHWLVCAHIIRHALSQPLSVGLGIAFLYNLGFYQLMDALFPMVGV
ncbi:MAG: hypothetical protein QX197_11215 [Methylococcaceae bacterium]